MEATNSDLQQAGDWTGYLLMKSNFITSALRECDKKIIGIFSGNRAGKTNDVVADYVDRILGRHPIEWKNIRPNTPIRVIRFASETLPLESEGEEIRNTIYPAFKARFPSYLIKKDITFRKPVITIKDIQGGPDIYIEFVSYSQETQTQAGVDRFSVYLDEHAPLSFYQEQIPRLLSAMGDLIVTLTPVEYISWEFETIFSRADVIYSSPFIVEYMKKTHGAHIERIEKTGNRNGIGVIRAATDDNPIYTRDQIDEIMSKYDDIDTYEIRRYGIFHQISGRILKDFDPSIHRISKMKYFPDGLPHDWIHGRGLDFHEHTNWACIWVALSPEDEVFIYEEYNPSPDKMVSLEIAREVAIRSKDYKYHVNLVDPRMAIRQSNTGLTTLDDFNRYFREFKRNELCTGGYWQTWDTKNERGRDIVKQRLKNSRLVGKPFCNNKLPTLWILDNCPQTVYSFKNWKWEEWGNRQSMLLKEEKNKAEDKHSHFPIAIECLFKSPAFNSLRFKGSVVPHRPCPYRREVSGRVIW